MVYQTPTFFGRLRLVFIALAAIVGLMILAEATLTRIDAAHFGIRLRLAGSTLGFRQPNLAPKP